MTYGLILSAHLFTTFAMTGIIWFVQIVHYPLLSKMPREGFSMIEREHCDRTGVVVGPLMVIEAFTLGMLLLQGVISPLFFLSALLLGIVWLSTIIFQIPCHRSLLGGWDAQVHRRLVLTNWIRTAAWTLRSVIVAGIFI